MRIIVTLFLLIVLTQINAQKVDSVNAILIRFEVKRDMKESLRKLEGAPRIQEFYMIIRDEVVLTREVAQGGTPIPFYTYWDTGKREKYRCLLDSTGVRAALEDGFYPEVLKVEEVYPDSIRKIKGLDCRGAVVVTKNQRLDMWYTTTFGLGFSPVGEVQGVPLYFEKEDEIDGRLRYKAVELEPVKVPALWVDVSRYDLFQATSPPARETLTTPQTFTQFARKDIDGELFSTADSDDNLLVISFRPERPIDTDPDIETLNRLAGEFEGRGVRFVSVWKGSPKKVTEYLGNTTLVNTKLPKCGQLFSQNGIAHRPTHLIIDSRGYVRYKYTGYLGAPLYKAMSRDLEELIR